MLKLVGEGGCPTFSNGEWRALIPKSSHSDDSKMDALHLSQLHRFTLHRVLIMIPLRLREVRHCVVTLYDTRSIWGCEYHKYATSATPNA